MVRVSSFIVVTVNAVLLLAGLTSLLFGLYYVVRGSTYCERGITDPLLAIGGFLVGVALLGLIGFAFNSSVLMFVYLGVLFVLIVALIVFTVFVILVTNQGAGKVFSRRGIDQHKTGDYSNWLHNHFLNHKNWNQIKSCLIDSNVCHINVPHHNVANRDDKGFVNFKKSLPAIQAGCCKPPTACGFHAKNETFWEAPKKGPASKDSDCLTWSNNNLELCYDCKSCQGGVLVYFRKQWKTLAIINCVLLVFLTFVYSVGCCARRSEPSHKKYFKGFA